MTLSQAASLASLPLAEQREILASLSDGQADELLNDWRFWARPEQIAPDGDWLTWVINAGRGFGKTRAGAEWVREQVLAGRQRIALIGETYKDLVEVMCFGDSGIASVFPDEQKPKIVVNPNVQIEFHTGAIALGYNATKPDQLRGPQFDLAWCFIAGTLVATKTGPKPIEDIKAGDQVWTRMGLKEVSCTTNRIASVGSISFSNGVKLVGTADHPLLSAHGWTKMGHLKKGDLVCAANVSNGAEGSGTATTAVTTSGRIKKAARAKAFDFTVKSINSIMAMCRTIWMFTISTATKRITTFPISQLFRAAITSRSTIDLAQSQGRITPAQKFSSLALVAGSAFAGVGRVKRSVSLACGGGLKTPEKQQGDVFNAVTSSCPEVETYAASVASIWQPSGEQRVFCLTVDGQPEYVANGILVHNCDELAKWMYARQTWDMLQFCLRLGDRPQALVTTTPRPIPVLKEIMAADTTVVTRGSTFDNAANLAGSFLKAVKEKYEGTRLGRQELDAEMLDDLPGALWTRAMFDEHRQRDVPEMRRVVVAVDPSGTGGADDDGDSIGIVVAGLGIDGRGYVLADRSCKLSPDGWGRRAVEAYHEFKADRIVAERNYGGAMVEHVIRTVDRKVSYKEVVASRGKVARAEPVAALYEQGRVSHIGALPDVEDQCCLIGPDGYVGEGSPDRADALVWALTELMLAEQANAWVLSRY